MNDWHNFTPTSWCLPTSSGSGRTTSPSSATWSAAPRTVAIGKEWSYRPDNAMNVRRAANDCVPTWPCAAPAAPCSIAPKLRSGDWLPRKQVSALRIQFARRKNYENRETARLCSFANRAAITAKNLPLPITISVWATRMPGLRNAPGCTMPESVNFYALRGDTRKFVRN